VAFYELRHYKILPGKMEEWIRLMEEEVIPFQVSQGMVISGSFRGQQDDSTYIWMRRFESEDDCKRLYKAVYESEVWKSKIAPRIPELMDRSAVKVTRLAPTSKSVLQ
jgi:hypothetical protein